MTTTAAFDWQGFEAEPLDSQTSAVETAFAAKFGVAPRWMAAAPGRVNLIGEHTDYNDGFVFPLAIDRYTVAAAAPSSDPTAANQIRIYSTLLDQSAVINLGDLAPMSRDWTSYVRGVIAGRLDRGLRAEPLDIVVDSRVPLGGGLSSSAALEVATATLFEAIDGTAMDPVEKARMCQKAEHVYAGMPCGIMDQFSSALGAEGKLLLIDCRSETAELAPMDDPDIAVLVVNSNVKHELTGSEYPERRAACEMAASHLGVKALRDVSTPQLLARESELDPLLFRRARHVVGEIERTLEAAQALKSREWSRVGELMYASHESLRDDYEVSCAELDALVEIARSIGPEGGVIGSRMTGGGFGGSTVSLVSAAKVRSIAERIAKEYFETTGIRATPFVTRPSRGAHIVKA